MPSPALRPVALLSVVAIMAVAGCGTQTARPIPAEAEQSAELAAIRQEVNGTYEAWAGSADARQAAQVLVGYGLNGEYSACMQNKGYDVPWEPSIILADPVVDGLAANVWLRPPDLGWYSTPALWAARAEPVEAQMQEALTTRPFEVANHTSLACQEGITRIDDDQIAAITHPAGLDALTKKWKQALSTVTKEFGTDQDYLDCLAGLDLPGKPAGSDDFDALGEALDEAQPANEDIPVDAGSASQAWSDFLALEDTVLHADWECRQSAYETAMPSLTPAVEQFETENAAGIAELSHYWQQVEAEAQELGWTPNRPYGDLTPEGW